ncbi:MAG: hypothetical protein U1E23_06685 [Reyranellaceae bacterium]
MSAARRLGGPAWLALGAAALAGAAAFLVVAPAPPEPLAPAGGPRIAVPWHTSTRLTVVAERRLGPDTVDIVTRRDSKTGTSFTHRLIDCRSREYMLLGEGRSAAQALEPPSGEPERVAIAEKTIPFYVAAFACRD